MEGRRKERQFHKHQKYQNAVVEKRWLLVHKWCFNSISACIICISLVQTSFLPLPDTLFLRENVGISLCHLIINKGLGTVRRFSIWELFLLTQIIILLSISCLLASFAVGQQLTTVLLRENAHKRKNELLWEMLVNLIAKCVLEPRAMTGGDWGKLHRTDRWEDESVLVS